MGLADDRKPVNLMTVHVSKSVTVHEVSNMLTSECELKSPEYNLDKMGYEVVQYIIQQNETKISRKGVGKNESTNT